MRKLSILFGLISIFGLVACGELDSPGNGSTLANVDSESKSDTALDDSSKIVREYHQGYVKPGADIRFSNDYDGYSEPGVEDSFILSIRALSPTAFLTLQFSATEGMDVLMDAEQKFEMSSGSLEIPVRLYAQNSGAYRFRVSAIADTGLASAQARSYSLTINVGQQAEGVADSQKSSNDLVTMPNGEKLIRRSAEEKIY